MHKFFVSPDKIKHVVVRDRDSISYQDNVELTDGDLPSFFLDDISLWQKEVKDFMRGAELLLPIYDMTKQLITFTVVLTIEGNPLTDEEKIEYEKGRLSVVLHDYRMVVYKH